MTKQEIFDKVVRHLMKQGKKSLVDTKCAYRGADGASCAVGVLINDEHYDESIEGKRVYSRRVIDALFKSGVNASEYDEDTALYMLSTLQHIHDWSEPSEWMSKFADCAYHNGVVMPDISEPSYTTDEQPELQYVQVLA